MNSLHDTTPDDCQSRFQQNFLNCTLSIIINTWHMVVFCISYFLYIRFLCYCDGTCNAVHISYNNPTCLIHILLALPFLLSYYHQFTVVLCCCLLVYVCFCCVRFSFFSTMQSYWLGTASPKWPILCQVGCKTLTQLINYCGFCCFLPYHCSVALCHFDWQVIVEDTVTQRFDAAGQILLMM